MTPVFRKFTSWRQRRRKEDELSEELQFHLTEEADERRTDGLSEDEARWEVLLLAAVGVAVSVPAALAASRLVESFLFGTKPNDPLALIGAVAVLVSAAMLAGYLPARHASRIDPMFALRHD